MHMHNMHLFSIFRFHFSYLESCTFVLVSSSVFVRITVAVLVRIGRWCGGAAFARRLPAALLNRHHYLMSRTLQYSRLHQWTYIPAAFNFFAQHGLSAKQAKIASRSHHHEGLIALCPYARSLARGKQHKDHQSQHRPMG